MWGARPGNGLVRCMASCLDEVRQTGGGAAEDELRRRRHTVGVLLVGLTARVGVIWYAVKHFPAGWFFGRGVEMGLLGQSLLQGRGLSSPFGGETGPTAMIAPGYPVLVAGVFRLCGAFTLGSSLVLMGLHVGLNLLTLWLILRLSRRVADERAAVMVSLFWACSLPTVWMPTIFWETNFSAALLLGFVAFSLEAEGGAASRGVYAGVAGLVNPALLPTFAAMIAGTGFRRGWRGVGVAGVGFLLVFSAWPVRNARVFGAFIPTRTTVGYELWMGNRVGATGFLDESLFPMFNPAELADYKARGEVGYTGHKGELAKAYMGTYPWATARLTAVRFVRFWSGTGNSKGSIFFALHAVLTTLLGGLGLVGLWRSGWRRQAWAFVLPLALFPLPYYLTHAEFRYRLVIDPLLCVLAAKALHDASRRGSAT